MRLELTSWLEARSASAPCPLLLAGVHIAVAWTDCVVSGQEEESIGLACVQSRTSQHRTDGRIPRPLPLSCAVYMYRLQTDAVCTCLTSGGAARTVIIALSSAAAHAPAEQQTAATQQHPRARSVRASSRLCVLPILTLSILASQAGPATLLALLRAAALPFPTGRPATASLRTPLALGRSASVSAKTSREGVFLDSPPACCEVCRARYR